LGAIQAGGSMTDQQQNDEGWHLDKRVPIALIIALCVQTGGGIWWASGINTQVIRHDRDLIRVEAVANSNRTAANSQEVQVARLTEQISGLREDIAALVRALNRGP